MSLAGQPHIVMAAKDQLDGTIQFRGGQRCETGPWCRLILLTTKCTPQVLHLHLDMIHWNLKNSGDRHLNGRRGLSTRVDSQAPPLKRNGHRGLRLEIEMLLSSRFRSALDNDSAIPPRPIRVSQCKRPRGSNEVSVLRRHAGVKNRGFLRHVKTHKVSSVARQ